MPTTPDDDWLDCPDTLPAPASVEPVATPLVWRLDHLSGDPLTFDTLLEATIEPPRTPEAIVTGTGGVLAAASDEKACWVYSAAGAAQIEREANGRAA